MTEVWKDISGYEGLYQVSSRGRVRSLDRYVTGRNGRRFFKGVVLSERKNEKGYVVVLLCRNGTASNKRVHRLVSDAFIPNVMEYDEVNHIDGDKTNNCVENLEWCSHQENINHAMKNGLRDDLRHAIPVRRSDGALFPSMRSAAAAIGANSGDVHRVVNGELSHIKGFKFSLTEQARRTM